MALAMVRSDGVDPTAPAEAHGFGLQASMIEEIFAQATHEQALNFFVAVGTRFAVAHALPDDDGLAAIEDRLNEYWTELKLGRASLTMDSDGIDVDHEGYVTGELAALALWPAVAAAFLRGAYGAWFQAIVGSTTLHTRVVRQTRERITLHHGR